MDGNIRKRTYYSTEEKETYLQEYRSAEPKMTISAFCSMKGLSTHTFTDWVYGRRHGTERKAAVAIAVGKEIRKAAGSTEEKIGITVNGTEIFTDRKGIRLIAEAIIHAGSEER